MTSFNFNKFPSVKMPEAFQDCWLGYPDITTQIKAYLANVKKARKIVVVECYQGVLENEIKNNLGRALNPDKLIRSVDFMYPEKSLNELLHQDITDDAVFGYMTRLNIGCFFPDETVMSFREEIASIKEGVIVVYGTGASFIQPEWDLLIYMDMARWEIQNRFRKNLVSNLGVNNHQEKFSLQYKRAFFIDWRVCDRLKKKLMNKWDFIIDSNTRDHPKMITGKALMAGLKQATKTPFSVVPFFDPGPWGGQWLKKVCDLDKDVVNYAWCFNCVPEENSLLLRFGNVLFETPSINLVFAYPSELLGPAVHSRFGDEFPIRFDFLDTMDGGNLSLQVHPLTEYIQENFGMHYTQDESYYIMDAEEKAIVYLGLKEGINPAQMIKELDAAQESNVFDVEKHVENYSVKKHDHILIPAGTVHCSGKDCMVLEISATPYIFTFKLWDWGSLNLDGLPRPIHIDHGKNVIQWERTKSWVEKELINRVEKINWGDGWIEERTGLHELEFIETRRHWFSKIVHHKTNGSVNVLNLVEGSEAIVESPTRAFDPFIVHYAETFIVPECVNEYTIGPTEKSKGAVLATIKAYVRHNA